jgi:hypothetical protein
MPTTIRLGRDQVISVGGTALPGTREFDVQVEMQQSDITSWEHATTSTLPIRQDISLHMLIYGAEVWGVVKAKFNQHPPQPLDVSLTNVGSAKFVPVSAKIAAPINGVMSWDVTLKSWNYQ